MSKKEALYILYSKSSVGGESLAKKYKVINISSSTKKLEFEEIDKMGLLNEDFKNSRFSTKEELLDFSRDLLESYSRAESLFLLSANDFNIGIESCQDTLTFQNIFARYGERIELSEDQKQKSIFNKFF